jgi:hypothetical protein
MEDTVNDSYRELRARLRKLNETLVKQGLTNVELAQALSRVHRAERRGDRSREPSDGLRALGGAREADVR